MSKGIRLALGASGVLSLALLCGRAAGLLRELSLASLFGVSAQADAAVLLLSVPDLLVNLLVAGGLSAALVPRLNSLPLAQAMALFRQASLAVLLLFAVFGALLVAWPQALFHLLAPGVRWPFLSSAAGLIAVAMAIPLTGLAGVAGAYLNSRGRFFATGCGTLIFNGAVLCALWLARGGAEPLMFLAFGVLAGAVLRWAAQLLTLEGGVWRAEAAGSLVDAELMKAFGAAALACALMLLAPILVRAMASTLGPGTIASFNYAQKLVELPVGILITSISTVALSRLSVLHALRKADEASAAMMRDTRYALLIGVAVAMLGIWFGDSVVHVLFAGGKMDGHALAQVTELTRIALLSVPLVAISSMATAQLNASGQTRLVLKISVAALLSLPLLALPGLLLSSERGLMGAVVAFQAVLAAALARAAVLRFFGADGVVGAASRRYFFAVVACAQLAMAIDVAFEPHNDWLRLFIAGCSLAMALLLPVRRFLKFSTLPSTQLSAL